MDRIALLRASGAPLAPLSITTALETAVHVAVAPHAGVRRIPAGAGRPRHAGCGRGRGHRQAASSVRICSDGLTCGT